MKHFTEGDPKPDRPSRSILLTRKENEPRKCRVRAEQIVCRLEESEALALGRDDACAMARRCLAGDYSGRRETEFARRVRLFESEIFGRTAGVDCVAGGCRLNECDVSSCRELAAGLERASRGRRRPRERT